MQNYNSKKMPQKGKKIFGKPLKGPDIYNKGKDKIIFTPENWRTVKQFELSTSESESSTESENDTEKQFDELKTVLETEKRLREEAEKKLAETLKQLEDSKKSEPTMEQIQRVETPTQITTKAIVEHTPPSDKSVHLNFTRSFFSNPPNNTMATKSHSITIADQLEQDLKNMDKTVVTLTTPVYIKETESQLPLSNAAAQLMAEHKKQLEQDKKNLSQLFVTSKSWKLVQIHINLNTKSRKLKKLIKKKGKNTLTKRKK
jgi:DNA gyrase/topoisomerase IV subunit A